MTKSEKVNYRRYQRVASVLQSDCYGKFGLKHKQFIPCPKGLVFTDACSQKPVPVTELVTVWAAMTPCRCHSDYSQSKLIEIMLEVT